MNKHGLLLEIQVCTTVRMNSEPAMLFGEDIRYENEAYGNLKKTSLMVPRVAYNLWQFYSDRKMVI